MASNIKNFDEFLNARKAYSKLVSDVERKLRRVGIELVTEIGSIQTVNFNWHSHESICSEVSNLGFFEELNQGERFALAIAVSEETANGFCDDSEIELVNNFFNIKITREIISRIGSRFI